MILKVSQDHPAPIFAQIVTGVLFSVAKGEIEAGESLPSVRALAKDILINPNTVARAYEDLARRKIVEKRRGVGLFVTKTGAKKAKVFRQEHIRTRLLSALSEGAEAGLSRDEILGIVDHILKTEGLPV